MKLTKFLYQYAFIAFILFMIAALVAFWPSYYSKLNQTVDTRNHTHGIGMSLWIIVLITQALLVRYKKYKMHKYIGWLSYVLVPYIVISTLDLLHHLLKGINQYSVGTLSFMALVIMSLVAFIVIYAIAIYNKKTPLVHARYMFATIFPLVTPITDRIISRHYASLMEYALERSGRPNIQSLGFMLVDFLIVLLIFWDYKSHNKKYIFFTVLIVNLVFQFSVFNFHNYDIWKAFCVWFGS